MAIPASQIMAELEALQGEPTRTRQMLRGNLDAPPDLRRGPGSGQALRQGENALATVALSAALGPVGLLVGAGMMAGTRRERRIREAVFEDTQQGLRQQNEDFAARTAFLREQFAAGAEAGDEVARMNAAQLDEIARRHAEGYKLSQEFDPERRAAGMAIMNEASSSLGGWIEDIESRMEQQRDQEFSVLRTELTAATDNLDSVDTFRNDEINNFGVTQRLWEETSNAGQRRAIFNDYMGTLRENFGDAAVMQALTRAGVTIGATVLGAMAGGPAGGMAGFAGGAAGSGQLAAAIAKGEIEFSEDEMRRMMAAAHTWKMQSSEMLREQHVERVEGITQRLQTLNTYSTLPESFTREYRRPEIPPLRQFGDGDTTGVPSREARERMLRDRDVGGIMREATRQFRQNTRPTEETP